MTNEKLVPMTTEEEDRNADVVRIVTIKTTGNYLDKNRQTSITTPQQKEIKDAKEEAKSEEEVERLSNLMQKLKKLLPKH